MTDTQDTSPEAVERLREIADYAETDTSKAIWDYAEAIRGAADQIETLSAALEVERASHTATIIDWQADHARADLCDPTQDARVRALVEAAQAQLDYMDMCRERGDLERNLRAALRALEQGNP